MTDIFLSYSSKDRERVRPLRDALTAAGYEVFWDQETPAGVNWNKWIMEHLDRARLVVVAWSKSSVESDPVIHEATIARDYGKLVPCLLDPLTTREFPIGFYMDQAAVLAGWAGQTAHKGYVDLIQAVRARLGGSSEKREGGEVLDAVDLRPRTKLGRAWAQIKLGWTRLTADLGDAYAQRKLGWMYENGRGVAKDEREAARLYKLAADQGNAYAQGNLGRMYEDGRGVAKDEWEAARLYKLAADKGDAYAQGNLGRMYEKGRGVAKDEWEAARLYRLAADQGNVYAQGNLGRMYEDGRGVVKDEQEAVRLYKLAADQGNAHAQSILGRMYEKGRGVAKDEPEAVRLYKLAADRGNAYGQSNLGRMYEFGLGGLTRNLLIALHLYQLAASAGDKTAKDSLLRLGVSNH